MRPTVCPAMWPRVLGSWVPLIRSTLSLLAPGWEHSPTAKGTTHASAGMFALSSANLNASAFISGLHSFGRVSEATVSRDYRGLARLLRGVRERPCNWGLT